MWVGESNMIWAKNLCLPVIVFISLPTGLTITPKLASMIAPDMRLLDVGYSGVEEHLAQLSLIDVYSFMLSKWADCERIDANEQPLKFLVPLLELCLRRFEAVASFYYRLFLVSREKVNADVFASSWRPLRDAIMTAKLLPKAIIQYDSCHAGGALQKSGKLQQILRRFAYLHEIAVQLEQHVRDDLQLQVGHLSLQESRESIKQSEIAIKVSKVALEESKRVKMRMFIVPAS